MSRQRLAQAIVIQWSPTLAEQVRRRVVQAVVRRRKRRRTVVIVCVLLFAGGVSYAFSRGFLPGQGRVTGERPPAVSDGRRGAAPPAAMPAVEPSASPAPAATTTATAPAPALSAVPSPATKEPSVPDPRPRREPTKAAASAQAPGQSDAVAALFAAADAARLRRRYADAVGPLTTIFTRYPSDSRAALAAFQLGRMLADDVGDHPGAARAFAEALARAPAGPLAADAKRRVREALDHVEEPSR